MKKTYVAADLKGFKIAVLCGGTSNEREVSLNSGAGIYQALAESKLNLNVHMIDPQDYDILNLKKDGFNLVFNTLHGRFGEDGVVQAILDYLGIKYTGVKVLQSALTLDKILTKKIWIADNIPTAKLLTFTAQEVTAGQINFDEVVATLGLPLFIKPNVEGSSVGITKVKTIAELAPALELVAKIDNNILAEAYIDGREFSVPVLNGKALAAVEIIKPQVCEFYDYHAKYISNDTRYECPANLDNDATARILKLAEDAANAVNIKSWCRVDILASQDGSFYALEVNTNPGMTTHSLFPKAANVCGMSYEDLCVQVLLNALNDVEN